MTGIGFDECPECESLWKFQKEKCEHEGHEYRFHQYLQQTKCVLCGKVYGSFPQPPQWEEEFDEKYPAFQGVGASFPIFSDNPNREHIKSFIKTLLEKTREEAEAQLTNVHDAFHALGEQLPGDGH